MKKLFSFLILFAALSLIACNNEKKADKSETKTEEKVDDGTKTQSTPAAFQAKAHVCGPDCKDGNHVYAHGDVGHTCTEACGKTHACTDACKDGKHVYAHGEVGHTCTDACMSL